MSLSQEQIKELQEGLCRAGYSCSRSGILTRNTRQAFKEYYESRNETVPDIQTLTYVPLFGTKVE